MTDHWDDDFDFEPPDELPDLDQPDLAHPDVDLPELSIDEPAFEEPSWEDPQVPDQPDIAPEPADAVFPPALDVGELPEPVDGFPWVDAATLGPADAEGFTAPVEAVDAQELAAYAGVDLPAGADPWEVLAADEDPATSALARWWTPGEQ
ncbi:hypothetical protein [Actinoplanes aureus]|uniref:Uncharacterized protein n=1 Tax=Actinoplanes aureus TaxID=2792083 RepID=A0A931C9L0_9ACTN|nr:hypothetical protein [Actinoplanes aureus]MBG0565925.1 hypothetical protein [Actinoplanes aureus]